MPFTGFWERWRRRLLQQQQHSAPSLHEAEKQRDAAKCQASKELAAIVATPSRIPITKPENSNRS